MIKKELKSESTKMKYVDLGQIDSRILEGFGDAGFASLPDKISSCCGYVILVTNKETGHSSILSWKSAKIRRVVGSSTAAEALAFNETMNALVYIRFLLNELLQDKLKDIPMQLSTDSKNLYISVNTSTRVENPHLRTDIKERKKSLTMVSCKSSHTSLVRR